MSQKFRIPLTTESVSAFRKLVEEHGGSEQFFHQLNTDGVNILAEFMRNNRQESRVLREALEDENYKHNVIESIDKDDDREFLERFFIGWSQWRILYPEISEIVRLLLLGSLRDVLREAIPQVVNDVYACEATIYLDTFEEDIYVKSVMKLSRPNKELGGLSVRILIV